MNQRERKKILDSNQILFKIKKRGKLHYLEILNDYKNNLTSQTAITLIALVITIIVMLVLAGVTLNATVGENGIITRAQISSYASKFSNYKEELEMNLLEDSVSCNRSLMKNYIASMEENDYEKFIISDSVLYYIGDDENEKKACTTAGVTVMSDENTSASDIINITGTILEIANSVTLPATDDDEKPEELVGERLYDKIATNGERWKIVIDYNSSNQELGRYGSGYYYLVAGTYTINGEDVTLTKDYVINYEKGTLVGLSSKYVLWSLDTTVAVTDGLVLNIDPTNLADIDFNVETGKTDIFDNTEYDLQMEKDGEMVSTGIMKYGDVEYDAKTASLKFNESDDNATR